jgi:hypothetical protein
MELAFRRAHEGNSEGAFLAVPAVRTLAADVFATRLM